MNDRLRDKTIIRRGFTQFREVEVLDEGRTLVFELDCGAKYRVPLEVVLHWYDSFRGEHNEGSGRVPRLDQEPTRVVEWVIDPDLDRNVVTIVLDNDEVYEVVWDVVLMSCEPRYVYFGGLNDESKQMVREDMERYGPFRIELERAARPRDPADRRLPP